MARRSKRARRELALRRWLIDQFDTDSTGYNLTRALLTTNTTGRASVEAVTRESFPTLVVEWQLANYLDNLPDFTEPTGRLRYRSWNFRATFSSLHNQDPGDFLWPYPLIPDTLVAGSYSHQGTLRGGSEHHLRIVQGPADPAVDVRFTSDDTHILDPTLQARIGVVSISRLNSAAPYNTQAWPLIRRERTWCCLIVERALRIRLRLKRSS